MKGEMVRKPCEQRHTLTVANTHNILTQPPKQHKHTQHAHKTNGNSSPEPEMCPAGGGVAIRRIVESTTLPTTKLQKCRPKIRASYMA
jgi:translation elongation factor EF-G